MQQKMRATMQLSDICVTPQAQFRGSIVVSISGCHAEDPGSTPGRGVVSLPHALVLEAIWEHNEAGFESAIRSED